MTRMIKVILLATLIFIVALLLSSCNDDDKPVSGTVTQKNFIEGHTETIYVPMSTGKVTMIIPVTNDVDSCWQITVDKHKLCVGQSVYDSLSVGSFYTNAK